MELAGLRDLLLVLLTQASRQNPCRSGAFSRRASALTFASKIKIVDAEYIERPFTLQAFGELLARESERSRSLALNADYVAQTKLPEDIRYVVTPSPSELTYNKDWTELELPEARVIDANCVVGSLFEPATEQHREWINLSPLGTLPDALILEVSFSTKWTCSIFTGPDAFPGEPFHLLGPSIPPHVARIEPCPTFVLPTIKLKSEQAGAGNPIPPRVD